MFGVRDLPVLVERAELVAHKVYFDVQPAMGREVEAAMQGVKTVKQALKDMDDEVTKILKS